MDWNGSVGIATSYGLQGQGFETRWKLGFSHSSRPALGPTQWSQKHLLTLYNTTWYLKSDDYCWIYYPTLFKCGQMIHRKKDNAYFFIFPFPCHILLSKVARIQCPWKPRVCIHEKYFKHLALACVNRARLRQQTEANLQLLAPSENNHNFLLKTSSRMSEK